MSDNLETGSKYGKGSNQYNIRIWDMFGVPPLIPVLVFSIQVNDLHLSYEHVVNSLVLETIDYLVLLSYPTVLEHVT
jgi:hypothetical protein